MANVRQKLEASGFLRQTIRVPITVVDGAAAGTFEPPRGAVVEGIDREMPWLVSPVVKKAKRKALPLGQGVALVHGPPNRACGFVGW
jgi:hypothetical protein